MALRTAAARLVAAAAARRKPPRPAAARAGAAAEAVRHTLNWVDEAVVGWGLCPFAARPRASPEGLRCVGVAAGDSVLEVCLQEAHRLAGAPPEEPATTLVVARSDDHPALEDFMGYLGAADAVQEALDEAGYEGIIQLATFHPEYCFSGEDPDSAGVYSNRAPHPTFHLLREVDVTRAVEEHSDTLSIPETNVSKLEELGVAYLKERLLAWSSR